VVPTFEIKLQVFFFKKIPRTQFIEAFDQAGVARASIELEQK
jgi:hypothetical protein